jgi:hypothetical protein
MAEKKKEDACTKKVKRIYKVWPSAYASGALVKCRKEWQKKVCINGLPVMTGRAGLIARLASPVVARRAKSGMATQPVGQRSLSAIAR